MMNIGIYFETSKGTGGAHHQNIKLIDIFKNNLTKNFNLTYIVPNKDQKKIIENKGQNAIIFKKGLRHRIEQFFFRFSFFKELYKKFSCNSKFENFLINKKIDLMFFNSPVEVSLLLNKINFIIMLLSMQHRTLGFFPEYRNNHDNEIRDNIVENAVKKSFKIFVGANKDKDFLVNFFNSDPKKIIVQSYMFTLPSVYEENKILDYENIFKDLKLPKEKNIFIYPAQFWAHKNHKYILDVAIDLKKKGINDIYFVFCGFNKGNLDYIKSIIKKENIEEYFKIFDYLSDLQLISLYKKCFGIFMPTLVGHTVIPMYEAFYFKKNIFYTKGLSDIELAKHLTEINIDQTDSFLQNYEFIKNNEKLNREKINNAKIFFDEHCNEKTISNNFDKTFREYHKYKSTWS